MVVYYLLLVAVAVAWAMLCGMLGITVDGDWLDVFIVVGGAGILGAAIGEFMRRT